MRNCPAALQTCQRIVNTGQRDRSRPDGWYAVFNEVCNKGVANVDERHDWGGEEFNVQVRPSEAFGDEIGGVDTLETLRNGVVSFRSNWPTIWNQVSRCRRAARRSGMPTRIIGRVVSICVLSFPAPFLGGLGASRDILTKYAVHAGLPTLAGGFEIGDDLRAVADRYE